MKYFVDTNVFLRFLVIENKKTHKECEDFFKWVKSEEVEIYISKAVLAEIAWVLKSFYEQPKGKIVKALKAVLGIKTLKFLEDFDPLETVEIFDKNSVKFIDGLIATSILKQDQDWKIVSYDKDFDKLEVVRIEPGDVVG